MCSGEESEKGGEEPNEATEDGGTETDKQDEKEKDPEKKSEAIDLNTEHIKLMDMKIWICENCSVVPKLRKLIRFLKIYWTYSRN